MGRVFDKTESKLIIGLRKVIERQNKKPPFVLANNRQYQNRKHILKWANTSDFYYPLLWHPLKYAIRRVTHTTYTYEVSKLPMAVSIVNRIKRRRKIKCQPQQK